MGHSTAAKLRPSTDAPLSHLAIEAAIHIATTAVIAPRAALPIGTGPCLAIVLEVDGLRIGASDQHLKHIGKLAVDVGEAAARDAELRDPPDGVLHRVEDGHVEAVFGSAAVGARGTFVFLVLRDVQAAPAGDVALVERGRGDG